MANTLVEQLSYIMVYLVIQAWQLAWAVSVGHLTISHPQLLEISRWRPFFKMADTLVEHLSYIMVHLVIQAWKLAWAVSVGHLTISHPQLLENSRWRPFFKMATTLVEQLSLRNHLVGDTSMTIAMSRLKMSFDKKPHNHHLKFQDDCRPPCGSLNDTLSHRNVLGSSKSSVKRGCLTVFCLTPRPRPVQFGKTCQELPPTGIALRVHWGRLTQAPLPRQGNSHKGGFMFYFLTNSHYMCQINTKKWGNKKYD